MDKKQVKAKSLNSKTNGNFILMKIKSAINWFKNIKSLEDIENLLSNKWIPFTVISVLALIIYSNSFTAPFTLDDFSSIEDNYAIRNPFDLKAIWNFYSNRFVLYYTISWNYFIHNTYLEGYHIVNLAIHILNGYVYYLILIKLLGLEHFENKPQGKYKKVISLLCALIFIAHPFQTNAVTYIIQRTASLASLFYMAALLFYIKMRSENKTRYIIHVFLFTILAMFTKENTITIPFMIALIEFMFFMDKKGWLKRIAILMPIFATIPIIPGTNLLLKGYSQSDPNVIFKASTTMNRMHYFYTQMNVITTYIRQLIIPDNQCFDYSNDFPISETIWQNNAYISFIILAIIGLIGLISFNKNKLLSLGILWFFIGLSVESSFISIKDVYFEHRLYFPIGGFILAITGLIFLRKPRILAKKYLAKSPRVYEIPNEPLIMQNEELMIRQNEESTVQNEAPIVQDDAPILQNETPITQDKLSDKINTKFLFKNPIKILIVVSLIMIPSYSACTLYRNYLFGDGIRLWSDVVKKAPNSDRAHCILATNYLNSYEFYEGSPEHLDIAEKEFKIAIDLNYYNDTAHCNLAKVYLLKGDYESCIKEAKIANDLVESVYAYNNLGLALKNQNKMNEAIKAFKAGYNLDNRCTFILEGLVNTYYEINDLYNTKFYCEEYLKYAESDDIRQKLEDVNQRIESLSK